VSVPLQVGEEHLGIVGRWAAYGLKASRGGEGDPVHLDLCFRVRMGNAPVEGALVLRYHRKTHLLPAHDIRDDLELGELKVFADEIGDEVVGIGEAGEDPRVSAAR